MRFFKSTRAGGAGRSAAGKREANRAGSPLQEAEPLSPDMELNLAKIRATTGNSPDLIIRTIRIGASGTTKAAVLHTDGLTDKEIITRFLESFMLHARDPALFRELNGAESPWSPLQMLEDFTLTLSSVTEIDNFQALYDNLLSGNMIILIDGFGKGLSADTKGWEDRGVQEASVQSVVRGPRESFSENLATNIALIRRRIKDPKLWIESRAIGRVTRTKVTLMYIKGIVNENTVAEVRSRLDRIEIDGIFESGNIEELIQEKTFTPFPTIYNTERPDSVAANLMEGRVAILVDGTPVVLIVPVVFAQFFQSPEDYYHRSDYGVIRILRYISLVITLLAPALFISITTFHQEMLPTTLMTSIAMQREKVPFPAAIEAFLMEFTFELLREAGIRMPRAIGPAISIVGALVLGEASVRAGLVSPAMVIVVSITAIASFVFPSFAMSIPIRILRFALMGLSAFFGLFGVFIGLIALNLHLCSLRSFGVPYMAPFAPNIPSDRKDAIFRFPLTAMRTRPVFIQSPNPVRQNTHSDPDSDHQREGRES
ncbi:spore germination protein [Paenibacillus ehimensis]|uniref:spore germination protein n=1 Tax=Paenibacillus ehimensis TaxID=79264 RepID=UPI00046FF6B8|nr:spore germination protein [Paenibacillus ehimensis]MEC0208367.1 spore germination protein [Paenibacillus ehimensis]